MFLKISKVLRLRLYKRNSEKKLIKIKEYDLCYSYESTIIKERERRLSADLIFSFIEMLFSIK